MMRGADDFPVRRDDDELLQWTSLVNNAGWTSP